MKKEQNNPSPRRKFIGSIAASAAALGLFSFKSPIPAESLADIENSSSNPPVDADAWFDKVKGKHRIVYDVPHPNEVFPFAWARIFLATNGNTGKPDDNAGVVVVLRHEAIGYAMQNSLWEKYNFGEVFKADDPLTKKRATRNPFWQPKPGDFKVPGLGNVEIGINELQASGVMFCVCNMALTVYSAVVADGMKLKASEVKDEWVKGILPEIQIVPSGVWAIGRAQEHKCGYCFAG